MGLAAGAVVGWATGAVVAAGFAGAAVGAGAAGAQAATAIARATGTARRQKTILVNVILLFADLGCALFSGGEIQDRMLRYHPPSPAQGWSGACRCPNTPSALKGSKVGFAAGFRMLPDETESVHHVEACVPAPEEPR